MFSVFSKNKTTGLGVRILLEGTVNGRNSVTAGVVCLSQIIIRLIEIVERAKTLCFIGENVHTFMFFALNTHILSHIIYYYMHDYNKPSKTFA